MCPRGVAELGFGQLVQAFLLEKLSIAGSEAVEDLDVVRCTSLLPKVSS